MKLIFKKN